MATESHFYHRTRSSVVTAASQRYAQGAGSTVWVTERQFRGSQLYRLHRARTRWRRHCDPAALPYSFVMLGR